MRKTFSTFILLFIAVICNSQNAEMIADKTIAKIKSFKFISHHSSSKFGNLLGGSSDYKPIEGECYFQKSLADTVMGYHCSLVFKTGYTFKYDGRQNIDLNLNDSTLVVTDLSKNPKLSGSIKSNMLFYFSVIDILRILIEAKNDSSKGLSLLNDTIVKGVHCKRLLVSSLDQKNETKNYFFNTIITIDSKTFLPVHCVSKNRNMYGYQVIENSLSNYKINDRQIETNLFSATNIPGYIKRTEYQESISVSEKINSLKVNDIAADWKLPVIQGGTMELSALKGKVVLLELSGVHCGFCLVSIKHLKELFGDYDRKQFEIASVYSDETRENLEKYIEKYKINYPLLYNEEKDKKGSIVNKYGYYGEPTFILIDKAGVIKWVSLGYQKNLTEVLKVEINKLLL